MAIDTSPLPYPKTDRVPIPANEDTRQYVSASDWNTLCTVVDSIRDEGGGSSTLAGAYSAGASASDQTLLIQSGDGGPVIFKANGAATGSLLKAQTSGAVDLINFTDDASHTLKSAMTDGASAVAGVIDTTTTWSNASAKFLSIRTNGVEKFAFSAPGFLEVIDGGGMRMGGVQLAITTGAAYVYLGDWYPYEDVTRKNGKSTNRWAETWSRRYATARDAVAFSATPTFDPANGDLQTITMTNNITSWTFLSGLVGEVVTIEFIQDGVGNRTLAGTPANVLLAGGTLTLSIGANQRDVITFRYDDNAAKWVEQSRAMNL